MSDIQYVCLSDMHLGEEDSLLTKLNGDVTDIDPTNPSPVMQQLLDILNYLISNNKNSKETTLILNGDILELALTTTNQAAMVFERFIELVMQPGKELFNRIFYIPGNHDHHLWELARETQYVNHIEKFDPLKREYLPIPWHTTNMFVEDDPDPLKSYFLTRLIKRYPHLKEKDFAINTVYPNFGLLSEDGQKCVIFHHGHFIESRYKLMSILRSMIFPDREEPKHIWDIEAENFAWIDFFWSTMGRSGEAGQDIELIYEKMHSKEELKKLLYNLADSLAKKYDLPGWGDAMERKLLNWFFDLMVDKITTTERTITDDHLSPDAREGLKTYMNGPIMQQILTDIKNIPPDVTFVFGHTHKPSHKIMDFNEYSKKVNVYNSGGWVVESVKPQPIRGGAVILVDDELNTVSLRMYNENDYSVEVREVTPEGRKSSQLYQRVSELLASQKAKELCEKFSSTVAKQVSDRAKRLDERIKKSRDIDK